MGPSLGVTVMIGRISLELFKAGPALCHRQFLTSICSLLTLKVISVLLTDLAKLVNDLRVHHGVSTPKVRHRDLLLSLLHSVLR